MPHPVPTLILLATGLALAAPTPAQQADWAGSSGMGRRPLNLSLPRDAMFPSRNMQRSDDRLQNNLRPAPAVEGIGRPRRDGAMPDLDVGQSARQPYGTGFEARQRGGGTGGGGGGVGRGR